MVHAWIASTIDTPMCKQTTRYSNHCSNQFLLEITFSITKALQESEFPEKINKINIGLRNKRFRASSSMRMERERKREIRKIRAITRSETLATQATDIQLYLTRNNLYVIC